MTTGIDIDINVPILARVEGEGALELRVRNGRIEDLKLRIYEPPRLFEKFLEGRMYHEVPDIVARICGICPVAYQMSAVQALEHIMKLSPGPWVQDMRRVFYCGEWIQSHALHIHLLAAPDFLGYDNAMAMAEQYADVVRRGLRLQALGNRIVALFGGRSVHPVGVCVGGFHHAPAEKEVERLLKDLGAALPEARDLILWTASLDVPDNDQDFISVALRHPGEYPMNAGRLISNQGLDIGIEDYERHFREYQVPHSTAFHATLDGQAYLVGPLARINLNLERLPQEVRSVLLATGIQFPSKNMFHSIIARAAEIYLALLESIRLLENYYVPDAPGIPPIPKAGVGYGCTEAPRGVLWHHYELDNQGVVRSANIIPPTSQNQARIEEDLRYSLEDFGLAHGDEALRSRGEAVIRNYDPCISCSTHFLKIQVDRQ